MPVVQDTLTVGLADRLQAALAALDADGVLAYVDAAVKLRTARGEFLDGSSPGAASYSAGHARERQRRGLQTARVDLFMTGRMLDATRQTADTFEGQVQMRYGYIEGLSEAEATKLARYHNELGAGGVIRRFVGLTPDERDRALQILRDAFTAAL